MNDNSISNRRGSVDGVIQRCGLCSLLSSLLRRAMCVGSRRGSGDSYYQELAETAVSLQTKKKECLKAKTTKALDRGHIAAINESFYPSLAVNLNFELLSAHL